jgi:hypothetical protein
MSKVKPASPGDPPGGSMTTGILLNLINNRNATRDALAHQG